MNFILNFFKGTLIGAGAILPGISSGVFCVIFGIYEKLVNSILNLFHDFKNNLVFLFPLGLGGLVGILLVGKLLNFLFTTYPMPTKFCFIGLILGSIPVLFKRANNNKGFRLHYLIFLIFTFLLGVLCIKLESILPNYFDVQISNSYFYLIFAGFFMSIGIVVPGVSSSVILMSLGLYSTYLNAISSVNLHILLPLGIGILIGSLIFLKFIQFLLCNYHSQTFYAIIGFVLGSVLILYPGFSWNLEGLFSIFLFTISFWIGLKFEKLEGS